MARATKKPAAVRAPKPKTTVTVEKSAGAVVFHRGQQVTYLLIFSTYWEFPKGLVEPNEQEVEAAIREVREETGLDVALVDGFRQDINYFYRRAGSLVKKQVVYFLAEANTQTVHLSWEHREAKWLPFESALQQLKYENAREILTKANELIMSRENGR